MKLFVDLHMHSCLSPCGHEDMTPNNIVNMAYVKGLDAIAVADHNTAGNLEAVQEVARERGLLVIPALEVTTQEEAHVLAYFPELFQAQEFSRWLYDRMPPLPNNPGFFGPQILMNASDEVIGEEPRLLAQAAQVGISELDAHVRVMGGVSVPAHINRSANGILAALGMLPLDVEFRTLEICRKSPPPDIRQEDYLVLHASDAHQLEDISEPDFSLQVPERSAAALFDVIRRGKEG